MITKGMLTSATDEWFTPDYFFQELNKEFHFDLDPCATELNHKCDLYFTKEQNGLVQSWKAHTVFCNPPYGRKISQWIKKAYEESQDPTTTVVIFR